VALRLVNRSRHLACRHWQVGLATVAPLLALVLLLGGVLPDPVLAAPTFHFIQVSLVSGLALLLALATTVAACQIDDVRVLFLALAFLGIASVFLVHALTTPGVLVPGPNGWVGASGRLALLAGALLLALSTLHARSSLQDYLLRQRVRIVLAALTLFALYGVLALASALASPSGGGGEAASHGTPVHVHGAAPHAAPPHGTHQASTPDPYGLPIGPVAASELGEVGGQFLVALNQLSLVLAGEPAGHLLAGAGLLLLGFAGVHYWRAYRQWDSPLTRSMLVTSVLLAQAQVAMALAPAWRLSWWGYHALMLAAFVVPLAGFAREHAQRGSLRAVVEGLLLRDIVEHLDREYTEALAALCAAIEAKDESTRGHSARVATLAALVGRELGLPAGQVRVLYRAGLLHDVGKIGIPDRVLSKPGRLTAEEFALVRQHPVRGSEIVRHVRSLAPLLPAVRWHHERLDGSGYPDGLAGDAIPLDARILAVADVFDALTSARPYRAAMPVTVALAVLEQEAGIGLDPARVGALRRVVEARLPIESVPAVSALALDRSTHPV
jgi:HD-GYP domain-containing protein (c-di-GMP phosphodiesterase class II)